MNNFWGHRLIKNPNLENDLRAYFFKIATMKGACQENCVNGYVRISRLEPVCQIVWQTDLLLMPNF